MDSKNEGNPPTAASNKTPQHEPALRAAEALGGQRLPEGAQGVTVQGARFVFLRPVHKGRFGIEDHLITNEAYLCALRHEAAVFRERYLWELFSPSENDPVYKQIPGQFRAALHDSILAPIYPFAFAVLTFAFLGAPRTTRQSRNFSIGSSIVAVFGLRMAGFACSVMAVKSPGAVVVQYALVSGAIGIGLAMIIGGVVVEPPAGLMDAINRSNARIARLFGRPATA